MSSSEVWTESVDTRHALCSGANKLSKLTMTLGSSCSIGFILSTEAADGEGLTRGSTSHLVFLNLGFFICKTMQLVTAQSCLCLTHMVVGKQLIANEGGLKQINNVDEGICT